MYDENWGKEIALTAAADLLEKLYIWDRLDLGSVVVSYGEHQERGPMMVLSTVCGRAAVLYL